MRDEADDPVAAEAEESRRVAEESRRATVEEAVRREGTGLHSGREVAARLVPAEPGRGLRFRRVDLEGEPEVPVTPDAVTGTEWETVLEADGGRVGAAEHLLAVLVAAGVDDLTVELEGPEPPALDGSAGPWCEALEEAGVRRTEEPAATFAPAETFSVREEDSRYTVTPHPRLRVSVEIDFGNPAIGRQFASALVRREEFCRDVAPARTFGLEEWRDRLLEQGLARGATHENTLVVTDDGLADESPETRLPDEFARHKLLDLVGDLALLGTRLRAHVVAERPSHRGNVALVRELVRRREAARRDGPALDVEKILEYLPHRYPFLLVDRVAEFTPGERVVALKNVTINEPYFQGHFPGHPIMPGVLIVEAMAQAGGLLLMNEFDDPSGKLVYFMSMDDVKFRRPVRPGDRLRLEVELLHFRGRVCKVRGLGKVDGDVAAEATMMARVVDR